MCLAVPAKVVQCDGDQAVVDLQGNTLQVSKLLTPEANEGDWVLVHAGFAIAQLDEAEARETWDYLRQALGDDVDPGPGPAFDAPPPEDTP
jgi:hydrogenase expression/formation protein HypC